MAESLVVPSNDDNVEALMPRRSTVTEKPFVTVVTAGSPRRMGRDFGRAVKVILRELVEETAAYYRVRFGKDVDAIRRMAENDFLPPTVKTYPRYVEEMRGIAEGAGIRFEDLFFMAADEELVEMWLRTEHCSTVAVRTPSGIRIGQNEDYPARYLGRLVIVEARPDDAPAFLALTYPYALAGPSCGLNAAGMAFAVNSLSYPPARHRGGIPTVFALRDLFRATSIADVPRFARCPDGLMGYAVTAASAKEDAMITVEVRPGGEEVATLAAAGAYGLAHTNHSLALSTDHADERPSRSSYDRLAALGRLLPTSRPHSPVKIRAALSSVEEGLLRPPGRPDADCTIATAVIDPARGTLDVAKRGPQGHGFRRYRLRER
jgi:hypothetical protein